MLYTKTLPLRSMVLETNQFRAKPRFMYFEVKTKVELDITHTHVIPVKFLWHLICIKTQKSIWFISKGTCIPNPKPSKPLSAKTDIFQIFITSWSNCGISILNRHYCYLSIFVFDTFLLDFLTRTKLSIACKDKRLKSICSACQSCAVQCILLNVNKC